MTDHSNRSCAKCGIDLPSGARRCAQCGNPIANVAAPPSPAASLRDKDGKRVEIASDKPTRLGRGSENDIVIADKSVSRHHANITAKDGSYVVRDLESSNGTFLDGQKIQSAQLSDGNRIRFGDIEWTIECPSHGDAGAVSGRTDAWSTRSLLTLGVGALLLIGVMIVVGSRSGPFNLLFPIASKDLAGDWFGELPSISRDPPDTSGEASETVGLSFNLVNDQVVMNTALYASPDVTVRKLMASAKDATHLHLEEEFEGKDSSGQAIFERINYEVALSNSQRIDCTETSSVYRDPAGEPVATIVYQGTMSRISSEKKQALMKQYEQQGWQRRSEVEAPIPGK